MKPVHRSRRAEADIDAVLDWYETEAPHKVGMLIDALMAANAAFYRRLGYAVDNEEPKPDGRVVLNMSKRL